jgi:hypothetical protein
VVSVRALVALLIAALLLGLTPVAYSDAPDPTWLAGYWDGDDFDNAVVCIAAPCAIGRKPLFVPGAPLDSVDPCDRQPPLLAAVFARAPPVAPSPHS